MNTEYGIYGEITNELNLNMNNTNEMEVASRNEIKKGDAKILLNLDNGVKREYSIQIEKIYRNNNSNNKSMQIKVVDEELLNLTGGIIQRNERCSNNSKWKIYRCSNACTCKFS